jgi:excisionase family DNA binding protein
MTDEVMRVEEVAAFLRVSPWTIRHWYCERKIPFHRVGRSVRFHKTEIERFFKQKLHYKEVRTTPMKQRPWQPRFSRRPIVDRRAEALGRSDFLSERVSNQKAISPVKRMQKFSGELSRKAFRMDHGGMKSKRSLS